MEGHASISPEVIGREPPATAAFAGCVDVLVDEIG